MKKTKEPYEALAKVMGDLADAFTEERRKQKPYRELFEAGSTYTGLLRELEAQCGLLVMDAFDIYATKLGGNPRSREALSFLFAVPYLSRHLERIIKQTEGSPCCVDKSFYLLSEELKRITEKSAAPDEANRD